MYNANVVKARIRRFAEEHNMSYTEAEKLILEKVCKGTDLELEKRIRTFAKHIRILPKDKE